VALDARPFGNLRDGRSCRTQRGVQFDGGFDDPAAGGVSLVGATAQTIASLFRCTLMCI